MLLKHRVTACLLSLLLAPAASIVRADADSGSATPEPHCLPISRIERIEIVDDETLRFHMQGKPAAYLNRLPHPCHGLQSYGTFTHSTATNDYCDLDLITVLDTASETHLNTCPLGRFEVETTVDGDPDSGN